MGQTEKKADYNAVRDALCELHRDVAGEKPKCLTSVNGKCPLAEFFCYECASAGELIRITPPNGRCYVEKALKKVAKDLGIELLEEQGEKKNEKKISCNSVSADCCVFNDGRV